MEMSAWRVRRSPGPVGLDGKMRTLVALSAFYLEIDAAAMAPVLAFQENVIALHFRTDTDAEAFEHVYGNEEVGDAARVVDIEDGFFGAKGKGGQKAGNELRPALAGNVCAAGKERSGHRQRQAAVGLPGQNTFVLFRVQAHAESRHDLVRAGQGAPQEGPLSAHTDGLLRQRGQKRNHHPGKEAGFPARQLPQVQAARDGPYPFDNKLLIVNINGCAEGPGRRKGALAVAAGGIALQHRNPLGQGGRHDGPLREALGGGHGKGPGLDKAERTVHGFPHGDGGQIGRAHV